MKYSKLKKAINDYKELERINEKLKNINLLKQKGKKPLGLTIMDNECEKTVDIFDEKEIKIFIEYIEKYYLDKRKNILIKLKKYE